MLLLVGIAVDVDSVDVDAVVVASADAFVPPCMLANELRTRHIMILFCGCSAFAFSMTAKGRGGGGGGGGGLGSRSVAKLHQSTVTSASHQPVSKGKANEQD